MPIQGITQPDLIPINNPLRLRRYDGIHDFALEWYQDIEMVWMVDGDRVPYSQELLNKMYTWLNNSVELYFIEVLEDTWKPIGDVTFWQEDLPIVIGDPRYRGQRIGSRVISALTARGRSLGYDHLEVEDIYDWNHPSRSCFEKLGFRAYKKTQKGSSYRLELPDAKQEVL